MADWKIGKAKDACRGCERPFVADQAMISLVEFDVDDRPHRLDFCRHCFQPSASETRFHWETRFQPREQKRRKIDFERLRALFERWLAERPAGQDALLYLISLLLVRKRHYKMLDLVSEDGEEYLRLRRTGKESDSTPFLVPAPLLRRHELPELRQRLEELLDGAFDDEDVEEVQTAT